jgi:putative PIN family toxin of toxin-antitoxin system
MRVVADTNTVISGLFWYGSPRRVLDAARAGAMDLFTTPGLLAELEDVLSRDKFCSRLATAGTTAHELMLGYAALATLTAPAAIEPVILDDPEDDAVLACAVAARAQLVVSGDNHLLGLRRYHNVEIIDAAECVRRLNA